MFRHPAADPGQCEPTGQGGPFAEQAQIAGDRPCQPTMLPARLP